jgi:hypothetical protein
MPRNKNNGSAGFLFGSTLKATVLVMFIVSCCVGYVWQKKQIAVLSANIRAGENRLAELRDNNEKMRRNLAGLMSPVALETRAKELGLALPDPSKIWRLTEPAIVETRAPSPLQQYAAGRPVVPSVQ